MPVVLLLFAAAPDEGALRESLAAAAAEHRYAEGLQAAIALRDAGVDPWEIQEFVDMLNHCAENGAAEQKADLFAGTLDAFPGRATTGLLFLAATENARLGRRTQDVPGWMERVVDALRAQADAAQGADRVRGEAEWSMYRSYLAWVYARCGTLENRLSAEESDPGSRFTEVTDAAGLASAPGKRVAVGDIDGDGFDDLLFRGQLFRNRGDGTFEDATARAALPGSTAASALLVDLDNDGRLDVVAPTGSDMRVYLQARDGTFRDETAQTPWVSFASPPEGIGAGDLDGDGLLDLYVALYEMPGEELAQAVPDRVYRNLGGGRFEDATEAWGLAGPAMCGRGVAMADYDDDGDLDVYVANYRLNPNFLWRNDGGRFTDVAADLGVQGTPTQGAYGHSIGASWGDIDGDLDLDLVVGNLAHPRFIEFSDLTYVFHQADGRFEDRFAASGIAFEETHSDASLADYDNDGDLDLYLTSIYAERPSFLYQNDGSGRFEPVTWRSGALVFDGWGHAWLDVENDGDLDLVVCGDRVHLFRNEGNENSWIRLRLDGNPVGARVTLRAGVISQVREVAAGRGTSSQDSSVVHFGLGDYRGAVEAIVRWPGGETRTYRNLRVDREHTLRH